MNSFGGPISLTLVPTCSNCKRHCKHDSGLWEGDREEDKNSSGLRLRCWILDQVAVRSGTSGQKIDPTKGHSAQSHRNRRATRRSRQKIGAVAIAQRQT